MGETTKPIPEWKRKEREKADAILAEIVGTNAFREAIRDIIAEDEEKTKRAMFETALDNFFEDDEDMEESPILVKALLEDIESEIEAEIPQRWKDIRDHIGYGGKFEISIDFDDVTDDEFKPIEEALRRKTDEWIEKTTAEIEQESIVKAD